MKSMNEQGKTKSWNVRRKGQHERVALDRRRDGWPRSRVNEDDPQEPGGVATSSSTTGNRTASLHGLQRERFANDGRFGQSSTTFVLELGPPAVRADHAVRVIVVAETLFRSVRAVHRRRRVRGRAAGRYRVRIGGRTVAGRAPGVADDVVETARRGRPWRSVISRVPLRGRRVAVTRRNAARAVLLQRRPGHVGTQLGMVSRERVDGRVGRVRVRAAGTIRGAAVVEILRFVLLARFCSGASARAVGLRVTLRLDLGGVLVGRSPRGPTRRRTHVALHVRVHQHWLTVSRHAGLAHRLLGILWVRRGRGRVVRFAVIVRGLAVVLLHGVKVTARWRGRRGRGHGPSAAQARIEGEGLRVRDARVQGLTGPFVRRVLIRYAHHAGRAGGWRGKGVSAVQRRTVAH